MPESVLAMKTDWNLVSSSRCAMGTISAARAQLRLHVREAAEPDQVHALVRPGPSTAAG
jgi:hypothetical protein